MDYTCPYLFRKDLAKTQNCEKCAQGIFFTFCHRIHTSALGWRGHTCLFSPKRRRKMLQNSMAFFIHNVISEYF
jgi:hypothetical protein